MLDANIGLSVITLVTLDLGRTNGLSTQTPIDVGIELVVVRERPSTQRTLACGGSGGHRRLRRLVWVWPRFCCGTFLVVVVIVVVIVAHLKSSMILRDLVLPLRDNHSRGACRPYGPCSATWF